MVRFFAFFRKTCTGKKMNLVCFHGILPQKKCSLQNLHPSLYLILTGNFRFHFQFSGKALSTNRRSIHLELVVRTWYQTSYFVFCWLSYSPITCVFKCFIVQLCTSVLYLKIGTKDINLNINNNVSEKILNTTEEKKKDKKRGWIV